MMNRAAWVAAAALIVTAGPAFGQSRPGLRTVGAFGGQGNEAVWRTAHLEMEGGHRIVGKCWLRTLIVDGELGRYEIGPDKIKMIRFLKPAEIPGVQPAEIPPDSRGNVRINDPRGAAWLIHGKVTTTADKEIVGDIHIPVDFALELEFGTLTPAPEKLRTLTLTDGKAADGPKAEAPKPGGP